MRPDDPAALAESDLIEIIRIGGDSDGRAVAELYRRHAGLALRLARHMCRGQAMAEDLVAEAFIRSWQRLARGNEIPSFKSYWLRAVRNQYIDVLRRQARVSRFEVVGDDSALAALHSSDDIEDFVETEQLREAWEAISPRHRRVLRLYVVDGYSMAEAADAMELTPNACGVLVHRARRALAAAYVASEPALAG